MSTLSSERPCPEVTFHKGEQMKYTKTKYSNIFTYQTEKGKRYMVPRAYFHKGKKKEISKSGITTIQEARYSLTEIEKRIAAQDFETNKNLTVDQYWEIYYQKRLETDYWSPNTEYIVANIYANHFRDEYGHVRLRDLTRNQYEVYMNSFLKTYTRQSVRQFHGVFMAILNDAVLNGSLQFNNLQRIHIGQSRKKKANKKITLEQFKEWKEIDPTVLEPYDWAFCYLTTFALRKGEIMALRPSSISFNHQNRAVLHISDSRSHHTPQGRGKPKTLSSIRDVTLDEQGTEMVHLILKESKKRKMKAGQILHQDDFLYIKPNGNSYQPFKLTKNFEKIGEHLDFHLTPHMLRHFFATQAVIVGIPIEHLSSYLGHSKAYMTAKYTHITDEVGLDVVNAFSDSIK